MKKVLVTMLAVLLLVGSLNCSKSDATGLGDEYIKTTCNLTIRTRPYIGAKKIGTLKKGTKFCPKQSGTEYASKNCDRMWVRYKNGWVYIFKYNRYNGKIYNKYFTSVPIKRL